MTRAVVLIALLVAGCTANSRPAIDFRPVSTTEEQALAVGSLAGEVRELLGAPHEVYRSHFGANTSRQWYGVVFVYHARPDELFEHSVVYRNSELVFAVVAGDTLLNHWHVESQGPTSGGN
jgi:hypothetical protein